MFFQFFMDEISEYFGLLISGHESVVVAMSHVDMCNGKTETMASAGTAVM